MVVREKGKTRPFDLVELALAIDDYELGNADESSWQPFLGKSGMRVGE